MIRSRSARRAPLRPGLAACALLLAFAAALSASTGSAAAREGQPAYVGLYRGHADEHRTVVFRIGRDEQGGRVMIALKGSFEVECPNGKGVQEVNVNEAPHARFGDSDHVEFRVPAESATVTMTIRGVLASGQVILHSPGCRGTASFSTLFQGHDVLVQPGRYLGRTSKGAVLAIGVTRSRDFFEVARFAAAVEDCEGKTIDIDASPDAVIEGDERVEFEALGGRAEVSITFRHRHYAAGQITFAEGGCTKATSFDAKLGPA